jgi:nucleotide-binding universal stress UspA family protein
MGLSLDADHWSEDAVADRGESRWRVLFPVDFGPAAWCAWPYALGLARALRAELVILHVLGPADPDHEKPARMVGVDVTAELPRGERESGLQRLRAQAFSAGVPARTATAVGSVRREIVRAAVRERAAVVVVGLRRRPVGRSLRAAHSVAGWVACHAPCSVWIVSSGPTPTRSLSWPAARGWARPARETLGRPNRPAAEARTAPPF